MATEEQPSTSSAVPRAFELIYPRPGGKILIDVEPCGRSGHCMVCDESNIYVLGGYNPLGRQLNAQGRPTVLEELWKFNLASLKWSKMDSAGMPSTCASSCLLICGNCLYAFGGTAYPFGQIVSNTLKVCDISSPERGLSGGGSGRAYRWNSVIETTDQPEDMEEDSRPPRGYGQSLIHHGQYLYLFGGAVGFYTEAINDMHRLDLQTLTWQRLDPLGDVPEGRYKQEIIKDQDCFYIVGGGRLHSAQPVDVLYQYTYDTNTWTMHSLPPHPDHGAPKPRNAFGFVQVGRDVYICGGQCYGTNQSPEILNDIWHLNMDTFPWQWRKVPVELPERMYFHRAVATSSGHLYVYGGVSESGKRSNKLWRYKLPYHVPALCELCWFKTAELCKNLNDYDPRELREVYGIPQRFIERL